MSHSCFIHSPTDGHFGCFHVLEIINNAAVNIGVLMFSWISDLGSFECIPRSGIAGSKGRSVFNFLTYLHTYLSTVAVPICTCTKSAKVKSGSVVPLALFFFLRISLAIWDLLRFHRNLRIFSSICVKNDIGILMGVALNPYIASGNMANDSSPWARNSLSFICVFFNFLQ